MIDLIGMKALVWSRTRARRTARHGRSRTSPPTWSSEAETWRAELIDVLSRFDDDITEKFLGDEEITTDDIRRALRAGTIANHCVPVLCGSAFKNKGVQPMLDAVVDFLPSPLDLPPTKGLDLKGIEELERPADDNAPFSALAFKIMSDPHVGKLTYFRVYSGKTREGRRGPQLHQGPQGAHRPHPADAREPPRGQGRGLRRRHRRRASASSRPPRATRSATPSHPIVLENLEFPEPVIHVAVEPKTKDAQDKLAKALFSLSEEDPTFQVHTDEETGQTIIAGMGELHLEVIVDRMLREFRVDANVGKPQVAYRETIRKTVEKVEERYIRQTGGRGQYGHVVITLEPTGPGGGYEFVDKITGGVIPKEYIPSVDAGIQEALTGGVLAGYPMVDVARHRSPTARTTTSTRRRWRSRSPVRWRSRRRPARPTRSCSSRSWRSRSSRPRTTWATSSATSPAGEARSKGWSSAAPARSSAPRCPSQRCSVTLPTSVRGPKVARRTPCSSTRTRKCPESISKEIIARVRGE